MPALPAISVILPCYNGIATVARAIDTVLAQEDVDFQLVVVDDGSTDGSREVIAEKAGDSRILYLPQAQRGGGNKARNVGVQAASAPLIAFIDADDEYLPGKLAAAVSFFAKHPYSDVLIDSFESEKDGKVSLRVAPDLDASETVIEMVLRREINKPTPSLSLRRDVLLKAGLFDESMKRRQDLDLILRLAESGARFATTSQVLWRKHAMAGSITKSTDTFLPALLDICERHPVYLANPRYRTGAARDFARSLWQLMGRGRFGRAAQDFSGFARSQGWGRAVQLFGLGTGVILRRAVAPQNRSGAA